MICRSKRAIRISVSSLDRGKLGTASVQSHTSGVVDVPNACGRWIPTEIFDFGISPRRGGADEILYGSSQLPTAPDDL